MFVEIAKNQHGLQHNRYGLPDIAWLNCDGYVLDQHQWDDPSTRCFGMLLGRMDSSDTAVANIDDDMLLIIFNAHSQSVEFTLPSLYCDWCLELDTMRASQASQYIEFNDTKTIVIAASSCLILSGKHTTNASKIFLTPGITEETVETVDNRHDNKDV